MPELVIIRGIPGTGKSTLGREFAAAGYQHFENDMYFQGRGGTHPFSKDLWPAAKSWCLMQTAAAMKLGYNIVVSNTFTQHDQYSSYTNLAKAYHYTLRIISLTEEHGSIHNVPEDLMQRIRQIWEN